MRADVVIVGAGAAGCVLARRMADRGDRTVLLLEAGPEVDSAEATALRDGWRLPTLPDWGFTAAGDGAPLRRGRMLGGSSWFTRFAVRGGAADFDAWAARGNPGWSWADVLPVFRGLESDRDYPSSPWHGDAGPLPIDRYLELPRHPIHDAVAAALRERLGAAPDHNAPDAVGVGPMPMSSRGGDRVTSLDGWLGGADRPHTLTIRTDAEVDRVTSRSGRATGVRLVDGTEIEAQAVILAAGTYGSPMILLRSGIGPAAQLHDLGVPVVADLPGVGEHLADHSAADFDTGWRGTRPGDGPVTHSIATFRSSGWEGGTPDLMFWLTDSAEDPQFYLDPILLKPLSRGRIRLTSADANAAPQIVLPGVTVPEDVARLVEGYELALEIANLTGIRPPGSNAPPTRPRTPEEARQRVIENAYSIPHVTGTCRMGPSPRDGDVVDAAAHVHGVDGLSVVDASIIPDAPAGFPHIIVLMAAELVASRLE